MHLITIAIYRRLLRPALLMMATVALYACGGGGSGGNDSPQPTLTLLQTALTQRSDTSEAAPSPIVRFTVSNPPTSGVYIKLSAQGGAVGTLNGQYTSSSEGTIQVGLWPAKILGAGTYTDVVSVRACLDSACTAETMGSPATIAVTYIVTGAANPDTSFVIFQGVSTTVQVHSTDTVAPSFTVSLTITDGPPHPIYIEFVQQTSMGAPTLVSAATLQGSRGSTPTLLVTLKPPTGFALGTYSENLQIELCLDKACTVKAAGSPQVVPITYQIIATAGREYDQTILALNASSVAWDGWSEKLYVLESTPSGKVIVPIDPLNGSAGASTPIPSQSSDLVLSDDGQFAYVPILGGGIQRFVLPALTPDVLIPLPQGSNVWQVAVAPGAAHTLAVAMNNADGTSTLTIFDDTVSRQSSLTTSVPTQLTWGADSGTLYALTFAAGPALYSLDIAAGGISQRTVDAPTGIGGAIHFAGGLIYSDTAFVFDPATHQIVGNFPVPPAVRLVADAPLGRAFVLVQADASIHAENLQNLTDIGVAAFPGLTFSGGSLIRWGDSGLAFTTYEGDLVLVSGPFINPAAAAPPP